MTSDFEKLWSSILLSSHIHVSLLSQSCRISLCTNPKDPNAQCVASKGMHEERLWAEGVTTHLCKLVKLRKRNNYRWQTAKPLFEFSHKKKTVREPALWPLFTVCPCLSLVLWVLRLPTSCISGSSLDQFQDVLTVVQVTAMWVSRCHRWPCPPAPAKDLGYGYDMTNTQRFTTLPFCFWAWLQHGQICRPDSSRSPAAKSPRSSAWTWQCNEAFGNTWDGRLTSQECLASFQMENMEKAWKRWGLWVGEKQT